MNRVLRTPYLFALVAMIGALIITRSLVAQPGYTDAFYHFNAANRLVSGQGLTDPYLWTYIAAPAALPAPSHLYWMPLTSLAAALGMWLFNAPGDYYAAQAPFTGMLALTACVGYWLGNRLGGTRRHAWAAGLLTLFNGFFTRFWGATDTFAPYALLGSLCLLFMGLSAGDSATGIHTPHSLTPIALTGMMAGLGHLARADGVLLLVVGWVVILWPSQRASNRRRIPSLAVITTAYVLVMIPWFARNLNAVGTPLPTGGADAMWYAEYNDLFNYPPGASPQTLFADGIGSFWRSRWLALTNNLGTFVAVEGLVVMTPLMLYGLWRRRRDPFLRGFWLYAFGLHLAMTLVFPFPGYRGGLFHSAAALVPWWVALGAVGIDDVVDWIARYRRRWRPGQAKVIFSVGLVGLALALSISVGSSGRVNAGMPELYRELMNKLPRDARVMINDPAQLYYFTGMGGVVLPNETPEVIPEIARRYQVDYLVLEGVRADGKTAGGAPAKLWSILTDLPEFLEPLPLDAPSVRLYAIHF